MVADSGAARGLIGELDWQDIDERLSRVRPVSCPVDPMRRYVQAGAPVVPGDPRVAGRLQGLQRLLEWAYGYRVPGDARRRITRQAPSAGALYPTETFVVLEDAPGSPVLYYHYPTHQFYPAPVPDGAGLVRRLGLPRGAAAVLIASVLWRSVQRYGVRGYRYCLLDAAHVASNLARTARVLGQGVEIDPSCPTAELEGRLDLGDGEALLLALRLHPGSTPVPVPPALGEGLPVQPRMSEQPPLFSPVLRRVVDFHRRTLGGPQAGRCVSWPEVDDSLEDLRVWAAQRRSAKDFTGGAVAAEQYAALAEVASRAESVLSGHAPAIQVFGLTARVRGLPVGSERLGAGGTGLRPLPGQTAAGLAQRLMEAGGGQTILNSCAFALVLAARQGDLFAHGHAGYRHLVFNAGFLCADLYREAARRGLGTTSIGGFSDEAISRLLGDLSLTPIVLQAFGVPAPWAEKVDAARIVGLSRSGSGSTPL
jgi:nitroreductase